MAPSGRLHVADSASLLVSAPDIWFLLTIMVCRSQANLEVVLGFELAQEDYDAISDIDFQLRLVDGIRFLRPEGPFRCAFVPVSALSVTRPVPPTIACTCIGIGLPHTHLFCSECRRSLSSARQASRTSGLHTTDKLRWVLEGGDSAQVA